MTKVLIVRNELEALRCKTRYPDLLEGASLFFPDETRAYKRTKHVDKVYYPQSISERPDLLRMFPESIHNQLSI